MQREIVFAFTLLSQIDEQFIKEKGKKRKKKEKMVQWFTSDTKLISFLFEFHCVFRCFERRLYLSDHDTSTVSVKKWHVLVSYVFIAFLRSHMQTQWRPNDTKRCVRYSQNYARIFTEISLLLETSNYTRTYVHVTYTLWQNILPTIVSDFTYMCVCTSTIETILAYRISRTIGSLLSNDNILAFVEI